MPARTASNVKRSAVCEDDCRMVANPTAREADLGAGEPDVLHRAHAVDVAQRPLDGNLPVTAHASK